MATCEYCKIVINTKNSVMITDEWYLCKTCYEEESMGDCEYSSYCNLTGKCDDAC
jgi:hypothetical protein